MIVDVSVGATELRKCNYFGGDHRATELQSG